MEEDGFDLFPNPASASCHVYFSNPQKNSNLLLYNSTGEIVRSLCFSGSSIEIERGALAPGLYLLHVFDEENVLSLQGKIIFK